MQSLTPAPMLRAGLKLVGRIHGGELTGPQLPTSKPSHASHQDASHQDAGQAQATHAACSRRCTPGAQSFMTLTRRSPSTAEAVLWEPAAPAHTRPTSAHATRRPHAPVPKDARTSEDEHAPYTAHAPCRSAAAVSAQTGAPASGSSCGLPPVAQAPEPSTSCSSHSIPSSALALGVSGEAARTR